ncbi:MAG TPA: glycosyltransferase family 4 protein [Candidatus Brocadiia bacterium]|nr:glycosyltransferase [Candidatus Brocadiales bacterium]
MKLEKIVYVTRLTIPKKGPRSLQVVKNCVALANQNIDVELFVKRNNFIDAEEFFNYYGLRIPGTLKIKTIPVMFYFSRLGIALFMAAKFLFKKGCTVFYLRDYKLAKVIISLSWLHRNPVFFESHQALPDYDGKPRVMSADKRSTVNYVHRKANGLIFLYDETKSYVYNNGTRTPAIFAWHGTEPDDNLDYSFPSRNGIYYVGNFSQRKYKIEILLEAMKYVETEKLILIGGHRQEDISRLKHCAKDFSVLEKVEFKGYVPPGEIKIYLRSAKVVVSLMWGSKLSNYASNGLPIIVPDMAIVKEVFRDGENCAMFQLNDARSLAGAINRTLNNPIFAEKLARNAHETAGKYTWQKRADKIINFIENHIN